MPIKFRPRQSTRKRGDRNRLEDDDVALVKKAQDGDRNALDRLLRRHYDQIYAVCRRLAGNDADALDATQEALIAIVRGIPRFRGQAKFTTWAYRVATNAALDELRRRSRRPLVGLPETGHQLRPVGAAQQPRDPGDAVTSRLHIDEALAQLPETFRAPIVLRDVVGLSYAEIAEALEIPPGTVRSRIARGRGRLASILRAANGNSEAAYERQKDKS